MDQAATGNSERLLKSVLASATPRGSGAVGGEVGLASVAAREGYDAEGQPSTAAPEQRQLPRGVDTGCAPRRSGQRGGISCRCRLRIRGDE